MLTCNFSLWPSLRYINLGLAILHFSLLVTLCVRKLSFSSTTVTLLYTHPHTSVPIETLCGFWPTVELRELFKIDVWMLCLIICLVTSVAHLFYACFPKLYQAWISIGSNPVRWIEYSITASLMLVILAILSTVRDASSLVLILVCGVAQMQQGYWIEQAVRDGRLKDGILPLVFAWMIHIVVWVCILSHWYNSLLSASNSRDMCRDLLPDSPLAKTGNGDSDVLMHIIWVTFSFFSSFGMLCTAYFIYGWVHGPPTASYNFIYYELGYMALSATSKTYLMWSLVAAVFDGELRWLQTCGTSVSSENCVARPYNNF